MKPTAIRLAEIQELATWTHEEMNEAAAELRAQHALIQRLIKIIDDTPPQYYSLEAILELVIKEKRPEMTDD
jgi:hypothetical protein